MAAVDQADVHAGTLHDARGLAELLHGLLDLRVGHLDAGDGIAVVHLGAAALVVRDAGGGAERRVADGLKRGVLAVVVDLQ